MSLSPGFVASLTKSFVEGRAKGIAIKDLDPDI